MKFEEIETCDQSELRQEELDFQYDQYKDRLAEESYETD